MATTRVAYLERDAALRGLLAGVLSAQPMLELVGAYESPLALLTADLHLADVVMLDADLGPMEVSGIELGLALRERQPRLGVVLFTEAAVPDLAQVLPAERQRGWSIVRKGTEVDGAYLAGALVSSARGLNVVDPAVTQCAPSVLSDRDALTPRQRRIMALAAQGLDGKSIAVDLGLAAVTVRQELSRVYSVLVPDAREGIDLRTLAVVRYLRATAVRPMTIEALTA